MAGRRSLGLWFRTLASAVMLAVLLPRIELGSIVEDWSPATILWLGGAVAATAAGIVASAARWRAVLAGLGISARLRRLLQHNLAGLFVGNFLPSTIGGDVLRVRRLAVERGEGADSFASVILERFTGMLVLPVLTLFGLAVNSGLRDLGAASIVAAVLSVTVLALFGLVLWLVGHPRVGGRLTDSGGWRRFAMAVHIGADRFRRHPRAFAGVLLSAVAYQLCMVVAAFLAARALGIDAVGITAVLAFLPAVAMAQTVPISLGGLGVREGSLVFFLAPLDVPTGRAVALGLVIYGLNLTVSLLGAPSFAMGNRREVVTGTASES